MNLKWLVLVLVLGAAAVATFWLLGEAGVQGLRVTQPKTHTPDYYFLDATVTSLNGDGKPQSELISPRIIHHPDDDSVEAFDPRMRYFIKGGLPWYAQADHGLEPSGAHLVYLDGHVRITHPDQAGGPPLVIDTEHMMVNLDTNVAQTDDPVTMTKGSSRTDGIGMDGYMQDNRMVLRTNVKGLYVPAPRKP
ncbi:MAG TPA: LPS export ABC transporter periplasmic protein LptC [Gammaproteobacteria bacterium]|nr:LPS export ABC transporter periplasmic protein LptC [Gammaproteobacteria bacterium]